MYCDRRCKDLNERKHRCEKTGERLTYIRIKGTVSFTVHEHNGVCDFDKLRTKKKERDK